MNERMEEELQDRENHANVGNLNEEGRNGTIPRNREWNQLGYGTRKDRYTKYATQTIHKSDREDRLGCSKKFITHNKEINMILQDLCERKS